MSKKQKNVAPNDAAPTQEQPVKKNAGYRILAFLLLAFSVVALAVIPYNVFYASATVEKASLLKALLDVFSAEAKVFGVLPAFFEGSTAATLTTVGMYLFAVTSVIAALIFLFAIFSKKKAPRRVRTALLFMAFGAAVYTFCFAAASKATGLDVFDTIDWFSFAIAVGALVLAIVFALVQGKKRNKKVEEVQEEVQEETVEEENKGFQVEEYAEAYAYEGGPVAGVLMAEEVNPSFLPHEPKVQTAGYDFYNCKSFDPFIATLNMEERNAFTEIFILKFKGEMPELPDYEVGGDNKEFFRKVFIYLGQYRDRIPSDLLGMMYQFSIKL
ncbi:MAG: hypothetical protein IKB20_01150 [Clostridia bacterium]|nr:hypothetical protein [Clostridia bacterium]